MPVAAAISICSLLGIVITSSDLVLSERGSGRIQTDYTERGSGRTTNGQAYRGSGRLTNTSVEQAYRGSGRLSS